MLNSIPILCVSPESKVILELEVIVCHEEPSQYLKVRVTPVGVPVTSNQNSHGSSS